MGSLPVRISVSVVLILACIILTLLLFHHEDYRYQSIHKTGPLTTVELPRLTEIYRQKLDYIRDKSTVFQPYASQQLSILEEKAKQADLTLDALGQLNMLTPNSHIGYGPIIRQTGPPISTIRGT